MDRPILMEITFYEYKTISPVSPRSLSMFCSGEPMAVFMPLPIVCVKLLYQLQIKHHSLFFFRGLKSTVFIVAENGIHYIFWLI